MRQTIILFITLFLTLPTVAQEDATAADSTVDVLAYFNKGETYNYSVSDVQWKINGTDTVAVASTITKATLSVVDSTKKGYLMEWRYTDFQVDDSVKSLRQQLSQEIFAKMKERLVGQTIRFQITPEGEIKKWENMKEVGKMARDIFQFTMEKTHLSDSLKAVGFDISGLLRAVDNKSLAETYTAPIEMLFGYHGKSYKLGDITEHIPASDDSPAADLNMSVYWLEPEKGLFCIDVERIVTIDKSDVKQFMGALFSTFGKGEERQSDKFKDVMGELGDMKVTFFRRAEMFDDGWPSMVIDQTKEVFEGGGKVKQTRVYMTQ